MLTEGDHGPGGHRAASVRHAEPDIRPLGWLALGAAVVSALLAVSYFLSPLAYPVAALAVPLGFLARGEEHIRALGTAALVIAAAAVGCATTVLVRV
ncbi:hypothetical protein [Nocardioides pantholopis]|uniref:hypothetical protein n=1 Tax=Nocardioides pantholopis TaxID=2483798 RepID=UPI000FDC012A|nr:hypothetical protein [Nocardioides pantholopis]